MDYSTSYNEDTLKISDNHRLHEEAGLLFNGTDEDGMEEWLGTKAQWAKFAELEAKSEE